MVSVRSKQSSEPLSFIQIVTLGQLITRVYPQSVTPPPRATATTAPRFLAFDRAHQRAYSPFESGKPRRPSNTPSTHKTYPAGSMPQSQTPLTAVPQIAPSCRPRLVACGAHD